MDDHPPIRATAGESDDVRAKKAGHHLAQLGPDIPVAGKARQILRRLDHGVEMRVLPGKRFAHQGTCNG
jgi:hypothetical protein